MKITDAPTQLALPFAYAGEANTIPDTTTDPAAVSWNLGFPPDTLTPIEAGGSAPDGKDMNGSMKALSQLTRWYALGGSFNYNSGFTTNSAVTGYPKGAVVLGSNGTLMWRSLVDDNIQDPNSSTQTQWSLVKSEQIITVNTTGGSTTLTTTQASATVLFVTGSLTSDAQLTFPANAPVDMIAVNATNAAANVYVGTISIGTTGDSSRITSVAGAGSVSPNPFVHDQSVLAAVRCTGSANALQYDNGGIWDTVSSNSTLIRIIPPATNTSTNVTMQVNGGTTYTILNYDGTPIPIGALQAGQTTLLIKQGSVFKFTWQAGVQAPADISSLTTTGSSGSLTVSVNSGQTVTIRNASAVNCIPVQYPVKNPLSITIPAGATLGTVSGHATLAVLVVVDGGVVVPCVVNMAGGVDLSETGFISPVVISSAANSASTVYSAVSVGTNLPYRVLGVVQSPQLTAGQWTTTPTLVQGVGGEAFAALSSAGLGQTPQVIAITPGELYYNDSLKVQHLSIIYTSTGTGTVRLDLNGIRFAESGGTSQAVFTVGMPIPPGFSWRVVLSGSQTLNGTNIMLK